MSKIGYQRGRIYEWDESVCLRLNHASHSRPVLWLLKTASRLGNGIFWYSLMLALLMGHGRAALPGVLHMAAVGLLGTLIYKWLKGRTSRPRPYQCNDEIVCVVPPLDQYSFPSGHTLHAVLFTVIALDYFPWLAPLLLSFTFLVSLSRVVLGLHYPSDVLAGAVVGGTIAAASLLLI